MKKRIAAILMTIGLIATACPTTAFASSDDTSNMYFTAVNASEVDICDDGKYVVQLVTVTGWGWSVPENSDVTNWFFNENDEPAFTNSGVAIANTISDHELNITIDASKIEGFTSNGSFELRLAAAAGTPLVPIEENKGQYTAAIGTVYVGKVSIPSVSVDGRIEIVSADLEDKVTNDTVTVKLEMDGLDDSKIDSSEAVVKLIEGDGYYVYEYADIFPDDTLDGEWVNGEHAYTVSEFNGNFSPWGGNGNGEYNINIGISCLKYNGLPLTDARFRIYDYSYGRTFEIETNGSLIYNTQPTWSTTAEDGIPVLCDPHPDYLTVYWPIGFDASNLDVSDFVLTLKNQYEEDDLVLEPGTDYTIRYADNQTSITLLYQYWACFPVYTTLNVDVNLNNLTWDTQKYTLTEVSHDYEIASVYAYYVMSGSPNATQYWTFYGLEGLETWEQVFHAPNYTLSLVDADGETQYYAEDADGNAYFTTSADEALVFDATGDGTCTMENNRAGYDRQFNATMDVEVNGETYTMDRNYEAAETLLEDASYATGVTPAPGYTIGETWSMHERWPWQTFIGIGYADGGK